MNIIKADFKDLVEVLFLMKECVEDLNQNGFKHWNNAYPGSDILKTAIDNGNLYVYKEGGISKGMVIFSNEEPEEYKNIKWNTNGSKVLYLKFLAVHPNWKDKNIDKSLLEYAELYAKDNGFAAVRVDVYSGMQNADKVCSGQGFSLSGEFRSSFQESPYHAYEKGL